MFQFLLPAFLEGLGLALSPCILPVLPLILAGAVTGNRSRPFFIIGGFVIFFSAFALLSRYIVSRLGIDPTMLRHTALLLLALFGLIMAVPFLSDGFDRITQKSAAWGTAWSARYENKSGNGSAFMLGGLIALIWTPCAGPLMAAALVQIVQAKENSEAFVTVFMFVLGAALPMLLIALLGQNLTSRLGFLKKYGRLLKQILGAIIIIFALLIYLSLDIKFLAAVKTSLPEDNTAPIVFSNPVPAPALTDLGNWYNSEPLTIKSLQGRVVLIDFWTYSCINCLRTLPHLKDWDQKYRDQGLTIIGIHTPEFEFEKNSENVRKAIAQLGIQYPVAQDNRFATWTAFQNKYWPAHYLIDQNGRIVDTHYGEGKYAETEAKIRVLLKLDQAENSGVEDNTPTQSLTPETYLGSNRRANFSGLGKDLALNHWGLTEGWQSAPENIAAVKEGARLKIHFRAAKVFLVMGTQTGKAIKAKVTIDKEKMESADVQKGIVTVDNHRLYELVNFDKVTDATLAITAETPGLEAYAFTFGE